MSLYACDGDMVCWLDADVRNFGAHFVTRAVRRRCCTTPRSGFVKGYTRRPLHGEATGGGHVTELMARPVRSRRCSPTSPDSCSRSPVSTAGRRTLLRRCFHRGVG